MTSDTFEEAYIWIWLPGKTHPVVAGRLYAEGASPHALVFNYGKSYLSREEAIPLYLPELPLQSGALPLPDGLTMPSTLRDAAPDAWGRRVILNRKFGVKGAALDNHWMSEIAFLLESGSDRIGALDFQRSPTKYIPRDPKNASLEELLSAAELIEKGVPLTPELAQAIQHGSSIGGARPKALIEEYDKKFIAKFSASNDTYNVVKGEFIAMRLASKAGLDVAPVALKSAAGKDVLLVERFDRIPSDNDWQRRAMVSALTMLELDEMMARYASYQDLTEIIRHRFADPQAMLRELFGRLVFNILCGNTDDHARNHAAFWDGESLSLTPAYDICPQGRAGQEAGQAMLIHDDVNLSRISVCLSSAHNFLLSETQAVEIVENQIETIAEHWNEICDEAAFSEVDRNLFWRRQFLNPFAFDHLEGKLASIKTLADEARR
ncbi:type II toxin-antitoxin system HipA family toxin [Parvularcula sp. IMCC14364]|uniref:type II toxin-antitoxin system HipA family toxin n=1 Tax=Parvularcula sp. IMCC14364 TaxID=3067902 RepID=UPI002741D224|nr:HipA domain-containing protein [Parvularcula sp. IMCC14364]